MRVGVVGVGRTHFGKLFDSSSRELLGDAFRDGLTDAWVDKSLPEEQVTIGMKTTTLRNANISYSLAKAESQN